MTRTNPKGKLTDRLFSLVFRLGGTFPLTQCIGQGSVSLFEEMRRFQEGRLLGIPSLSVSLGWDVQLLITRISNGHFLLHALDFFVLVPGVSPPPASARPLDALLGTRRLPVYRCVWVYLLGWVVRRAFGLWTLVVDRLGGWNKRVVSF